jgi:PEP-CTERM motif
MRKQANAVGAGLAALALGLVAAAPAAGSVTVRVEGPAAPVSVGQGFDVSLTADFSDPVLAWGLDLGFDPAQIALDGAPQIGPVWTVAVATADGDGLAGALVPPSGGSGVQGTDVLLATLSFVALAPGTAELLLGSTAADLTEGFALDPYGFDLDVHYVNGAVTVVPEPASAALLGAGLAALSARRRRAKLGAATGASRAGRRT